MRLLVSEKYMNSITSNTVRNLSVALAAVLSIALFVAIAPKAHAADLGGWDDVGYYDMSSPTYSDNGWTDVGYYDMSSPSYDTGYSTGGYGGGMGGFTGGWSFGGGGGYGGGSGYSSVFAPTNTCTATNSCNTTTQINAPTNIVTNTTAAPSYPVYQPVYTQTYVPPVYTPPAYYPPAQPIAYNNTPYVTLAAVPYTGLELGTMGTIAYWGFLVLWCLIAAYLIVVKKIQNKIAAWFTGTETKTFEQKSGLPASGGLAETGDPRTFEREFSVKSSAPLFAGIDSFVLSQINRAK